MDGAVASRLVKILPIAVVGWLTQRSLSRNDKMCVGMCFRDHFILHKYLRDIRDFNIRMTAFLHRLRVGRRWNDHILELIQG